MTRATRGVADIKREMKKSLTAIDAEVAIISLETSTTIEIDDMVEREGMTGTGIKDMVEREEMTGI